MNSTNFQPYTQFQSILQNAVEENNQFLTFFNSLSIDINDFVQELYDQYDLYLLHDFILHFSLQPEPFQLFLSEIDFLHLQSIGTKIYYKVFEGEETFSINNPKSFIGKKTFLSIIPANSNIDVEIKNVTKIEMNGIDFYEISNTKKNSNFVVHSSKKSLYFLKIHYMNVLKKSQVGKAILEKLGIQSNLSNDKIAAFHQLNDDEHSINFPTLISNMIKKHVLICDICCKQITLNQIRLESKIQKSKNYEWKIMNELETDNDDAKEYDEDDTNDDYLPDSAVPPVRIDIIGIDFQPKKTKIGWWETGQDYVPPFHPLQSPFVFSHTSKSADPNPEEPIQQNELELMINQKKNPASLKYCTDRENGTPATFKELSNYSFQTQKDVRIAMANISFIGDRFIKIRTSSNNRIEYRCIEKKKEAIVNLESSYIQDAKLTTCDFKMVWSKVDDKWKVTTYNEHTCPPDRHNFENRKAKAAHFPSIFIDEAIRNLKTHYFTINEGISAFKTEFTQNVNQRTLRRRLERQLPIDCEASRIMEWQKIPEYLENNIQNGGLSKLAVNKNNEIIGIGIVPNYGKLLLSSDAILPILIIDGTFQCAISRGVIIIVMTVSGNRTNIPLAWGWAPTENAEIIKMILELVKSVRPKCIETILSDEGKALESAIKFVFPNVDHKLCAWHIAKKLTNDEARSLFWGLFHADHPAEFRSQCITFKTKHPLIYKQYIEGKENKLFNRFFNKNAGGELSTSSPVESINSLIAPYKDKEPIQIFNILELYGYEQCTKLMLLKNFTTPYYDSRMNQVTQKANKFFAINVPGTESFKVFKKNDVNFNEKGQLTGVPKSSALCWDVNLKECRCPCGKYEDRGFPCAHYICACLKANQSWDRRVAKCYFVGTILETLESHINIPVPIDNLSIDPKISPFNPKSRIQTRKRHKYHFEININK